MTSFWKTSSENQTNFFANRGSAPATEKITKFGEETIGNKQKVVSGDNNNNNSVTDQDNKTEMSGSNRDEYYQQVSALNISVMNWIKNHVNDNPCIDLQPVFRDYEKHMKDIETKYGHIKKQTMESNDTFAASPRNNLNILKTPESSNQSPIGPSSTANAPSLFSNLKSSTPIPSSSAAEGIVIVFIVIIV